MSKIVDRRNTGKSPSAGNRRKLIERHKRYIKDSIDRTIEKTKIKDIKKDRKVSIPADRMDEPTYAHDPNKGTRRQVLSGNKQYIKGDKIGKPQGGQGGGSQGGQSGPEQDEFSFNLTKDEFLDILFEDMSLPNYIKESIKKDFKTKRVRAGYSPDGIISQLNLKKTFEKSLARRIAHRGNLKKRIAESATPEEIEELKKKKPPFIEEVDLRYNNYTVKKFPARHAVMFCLMDVSGSMNEEHKDLAKRFFILLYLFVERQYDNVEIRFIRHTEVAEEVDEDTFFYDRKSGGTFVSSAFKLMLNIIKEEYDTDATNIYVAQASDGDNWSQDNEELLSLLDNKVLPMIQYMAYIQVVDANQEAFAAAMGISSRQDAKLYGLYRGLVAKHEHFNQAIVDDRQKVFAALKGLFSNE